MTWKKEKRRSFLMKYEKHVVDKRGNAVRKRFVHTYLFIFFGLLLRYQVSMFLLDSGHMTVHPQHPDTSSPDKQYTLFRDCRMCLQDI